MIKKLALAIAVIGLSVSSYGQGFVNFNNNNVAGGVIAPVSFSNGTLVSGTGYYAQLFSAVGAGASEGSLVAAGTAVNFRGGANVGFVQQSGTAIGAQGSTTVNPAVAVSANPGVVTLQLRVWSSAFATYAAAVSANNAEWGKSALFSVTSVGAPGTPADLTGLTAFSLNPVPEPTTIALGILGAGSLLFLRRKK